MKNLVLSCVTVLVSISAAADVIKCSFTEPYVDTTYSMSQSTLTYKDSEGKVQVIKNVSFQIKSADTFELLDKGGKVLQTLTLSGKGSDGQSDNVFPYEAKDNTMATMANSGIGGCSSNFLKVKLAQ